MSKDPRAKVPMDEVLRRIGDGDEIHTFSQSGPALLGADWERQSVLDEIEKYGGVENSGGLAASMGHTLVIPNRVPVPLFIEAGPEEGEANE